MKIGILTQPLSNNYGGLLQAYALQTTLERMGHNVTIIDRRYAKNRKKVKEKFSVVAVRFVKNCVKFVLRRPLTVILHELNAEQSVVANRFTQLFIKQYHHKSPNLYTTEELIDFCKNSGVDVFVVGSDQCWRPQYSPCLTNYFLDFAEGWAVKRISYAASFGVDHWEFTAEQTRVCKELAQNFDAVSVREKSGIELCHKYLGVDAVHLLDPTMLLDSDDYNELTDNFDFSVYGIDVEHRLPNTLDSTDDKLFCYVLDQDKKKKEFISKVATSAGLTPIYCMPKEPRAQEIFEKCPDDCTFPPVELWLRSFRDSKMVIADSFHGMVFSIIYNKPFWVLGNADRGMARFQSLLQMFNLENRMVTTENMSNIDINAEIDWNRVNAKRKELKQLSIDFLINNLR